MYSSNKILSLFAILVAMFATLAISNPIGRQFGSMMNVPSPGAGHYAIKSTQSVSWWCNQCKPTDNIKIEVIKIGNGNKVVFTDTGKNAHSGNKGLFIDPKWAIPGPDMDYIVKVTNKGIPPASGFSHGVFTVFKTQ